MILKPIIDESLSPTFLDEMVKEVRRKDTGSAGCAHACAAGPKA
jgi:hypothetical protein